MLTKREIPTSLTLNQHTYTHTHTEAERGSCNNRRRWHRRCDADAAGRNVIPRSESGPGISVSALECIDFGLWFLGAAGESWENCRRGNGTVPEGCGRVAELLPLAFLHFNCMSRRKVCNEVDTGLQFAKPLSPPHPLYPTRTLLLSLSACDLHFAAGQRHSKFASNFVCLLPPRASDKCELDNCAHSLAVVFPICTNNSGNSPPPLFPTAFIIKCLRRLLELPKLKHLAHT